MNIIFMMGVIFIHISVCVCVYMFCSSGLDRFCWFDQSDPCYAALGHKLDLPMVLGASNYDLKIIKRINNTKDDPFCRCKHGSMEETECNLYNNRPEVTIIHGMLIINRVIRADSGNYRLDIFSSQVIQIFRGDLQVIVEGTGTLSSDSLQSHVLHRSHSHAN